MYNVCHNIYRNFPPNWMAQISVGYTLRGAFKTPFLENSCSENIPKTNPNTQEKALHQAGQEWQPWRLKQEEKLPEASRDEAITCERQTQLMRFIKRRSVARHYRRGNGTIRCQRHCSAGWLMKSGTSWVNMKFNRMSTQYQCRAISWLMHCSV